MQGNFQHKTIISIKENNVSVTPRQRFQRSLSEAASRTLVERESPGARRRAVRMHLVPSSQSVSPPLLLKTQDCATLGYACWLKYRETGDKHFLGGKKKKRKKHFCPCCKCFKGAATAMKKVTRRKNSFVQFISEHILPLHLDCFYRISQWAAY